jgi:hypothetical protein
MTRRTVMTATVLAGLLLPGAAWAQRLLLGGHGAVGLGAEGGDPGTGEMRFRPARLRIAAGVDGRVDETPSHGTGVVVFAEVYPHAAVGGSLRYLHWFNPAIVGFVGATGTFAPRTLLGPELGMQLRIPFDSAGTCFFVEPSFAALPLGTDLPTDRVLLWGLVSLGIHGNL